MIDIKYKRILLKLSGEALAGPEGYGINAKRAADIASVCARCTKWAWM